MATIEQFQERVRRAVHEALQKTLAEGDLEAEKGTALISRQENEQYQNPPFRRKIKTIILPPQTAGIKHGFQLYQSAIVGRNERGTK